MPGIIVPTIVRFPPSPTGKMHVGNARTALFNWLYARHTGGSFNLRIEDTDKERSTPENIAFIYEALAWLGLDYDNTPFNQTTRVAAHTEAAQKLVAAGHAFVDEDGVTRFKVPEGKTSWNDLIAGEITIDNKEIEAFALLRSDGSPTYHLGVVADDAFMGVTHVIRGVDHINNTPKHILLFKALGHTIPQFGHIPLIMGPDGQKLSKRHGAASIQDLRDAGYLPQAVFNYLLRLGWSHGDQELFTREEAIQAFDITHVHGSPAQFDPAKLQWVNEQYIKSLPMADIIPHLQPFMTQVLDAPNLDILAKLWPELTQRAKLLPDLAEAAAPLLTDITRQWTPEHAHAFVEGHGPLHWHYDAYSRVADWTPEAIHTALEGVAAKAEGNFKIIGKPLRLALTGRPGGPSLPGLMYALGQSETLRRLKSALHSSHAHGAAH